MSRSSTVTHRSTPIRDAAVHRTGEIAIHAETLTVRTSERVEILDLTDHVVNVVRAARIAEATASVWCMHTTCGFFVNEAQRALLTDVRRLLEQLVPRGGWQHDDPAHSDCDRSNADAHLRALLLSPGLTLQVSAGELVLGTWQRVLMAELDGPRQRSLRVQITGVAS